MSQIIKATEILVAAGTYDALLTFSLMRKGFSFEEALRFYAKDYYVGRCEGCPLDEIGGDTCYECQRKGEYEEWAYNLFGEVAPYDITPSAPVETEDGLPGDYDPFADEE